MRPCPRKAKISSDFLQNIATGKVIAKIKGSVKKLGAPYQDGMIVLYSKTNFQPIAVTRPDKNGNYQFLRLNTDLKTFVVAFDQNQEYNAVIQDNVVPK